MLDGDAVVVVTGRRVVVDVVVGGRVSIVGLRVGGFLFTGFLVGACVVRLAPVGFGRAVVRTGFFVVVLLLPIDDEEDCVTLAPSPATGRRVVVFVVTGRRVVFRVVFLVVVDMVDGDDDLPSVVVDGDNGIGVVS